VSWVLVVEMTVRFDHAFALGALQFPFYFFFAFELVVYVRDVKYEDYGVAIHELCDMVGEKME
jgi:hypothetical protein